MPVARLSTGACETDNTRQAGSPASNQPGDANGKNCRPVNKPKMCDPAQPTSDDGIAGHRFLSVSASLATGRSLVHSETANQYAISSENSADYRRECRFASTVGARGRGERGRARQVWRSRRLRRAGEHDGRRKFAARFPRRKYKKYSNVIRLGNL